MIEDYQSMGRVLQALQMHFQQKQYNFMLSQQKSAGMPEGPNGAMPTPEMMMMNGGYMMGPQMMNPMQYPMGMYQDQTKNGVNNAKTQN